MDKLFKLFRGKLYHCLVTIENNFMFSCTITTCI